MKRHILGGTVLAAVLLTALAPSLFAHCEMPCGIYDDEARIVMLRENIATIEKSMKMITELSAESPVNYNQLVRWIHTKEEHAQRIQDVVARYFLTQRIKPSDARDGATLDSYNKRLACLHQILVYAMKCKQTTDPAHVATLTKLVDQFHELYFGEPGTAAPHGHH